MKSSIVYWHVYSLLCIQNVEMLTVFSFLLQYFNVGKVLLVLTRIHFHISIRLRSNNNRCILKEKWKLFNNNSEEHLNNLGNKQSCWRK